MSPDWTPPSSDGDSQRCLDNSSKFFFTNFCNILGLRSNFHFIEHHLSSSKPHLLFLTETKVSGAAESNLYSVLSYCPYCNFQSRAGCCVYVRNDILCSRYPNLDSTEFSTIWLRLNCHSATKYICAVYLSPNSPDYVNFFLLFEL